MFPGPDRPFSRRGFANMRNPRMSGAAFYPVNRTGRPVPIFGPPVRHRGNGLLSKLFRNKLQREVSYPFHFSAQRVSKPLEAGGLLKAITNPNNINQFLTNTQKILDTTQQVSSMIQQYGPIVRNLPAMWKIYKGLKEMPGDGDNTDSVESAENPVSDRFEKNEKRNLRSRQTDPLRENMDNVEVPAGQKNKGASLPKLYI